MWGHLRWAAAIVMVAALGFPATSSAQSKPPSFRSPTQDELTRTKNGSNDWVTYGGALNNQRFSTLDQINTSNVQGPKGAWMTPRNSPPAPKYPFKAAPILSDR